MIFPRYVSACVRGIWNSQCMKKNGKPKQDSNLEPSEERQQRRYHCAVEVLTTPMAEDNPVKRLPIFNWVKVEKTESRQMGICQ